MESQKISPGKYSRPKKKRDTERDGERKWWKSKIALESPEWKIVQVDLNSCDTVEGLTSKTCIPNGMPRALLYFSWIHRERQHIQDYRIMNSNRWFVSHNARVYLKWSTEWKITQETNPNKWKWILNQHASNERVKELHRLITIRIWMIEPCCWSYRVYLPASRISIIHVEWQWKASSSNLLHIKNFFLSTFGYKTPGEMERTRNTLNNVKLNMQTEHDDPLSVKTAPNLFDEKGKKQLNTCSSHMFIQKHCWLLYESHAFLFTVAMNSQNNETNHTAENHQYACSACVILFHAYINKLAYVRTLSCLIISVHSLVFCVCVVDSQTYSLLLPAYIKHTQSVLHHFRISIFPV